LQTDLRGLSLSTDSAAAAAAFDATVQDFLEYRLSAADRLGECLAADPEFAFGHCLKGYFFSLFFSNAVAGEIAGALAEAERRAATASPREQRHIAALKAWQAGALEQACAIWDDILIAHPTDLLALRLQHGIQFWSGQAQAMRAAAAGVHEAWDPGLPGFGNVLGMYCFALEECGDYAAAEPKGREAVARNGDDLWAVHAVAHVLEMQERHAEGVEWLTRPLDHWEGRNPFKGHLWWHLAMYHCERREFDRVLELYDRAFYAVPSDVYSDIFNASSMLWRLEFQGVDVGPRWQALGEQAAKWIGNHVLGFNDVHNMMSLAGARRFDEAERLLAGLEANAARRHNDQALLGGRVGVPLARALLAFAKGDYEAAIESLRRLRPRIVEIGGSWAQRDVFNQFLIEAALRAERLDLARALLAERVQQRPRSASSRASHARVLERLGQSAAAARVRAAAPA